MWFLTRSTGIVAAVLAVASVIWGFTFSARNTGRRWAANWWLALHNWLGWCTLGFTALHMLVSLLDTGAGLRLVDLLVPNSTVGWAVGWGVVAFWAFAIASVTSIARVRRRLPRRLWHVVHLLTVPAVVAMGAHAVQLGTDATASWFVWLLAMLAGATLYPLLVRISGVVAARRSRRTATVTHPPAARRAAA